MVSPIVNEHFYSGAFLIREANGYLSRDHGLIANATTADVSVEGGTVLSLASPETATVAPIGINTGNGTIMPVTVANGDPLGLYVLNFGSATAYTVEGPNGVEVGHGTVGNAFSSGGLNFTVTAGSAAFVTGDSFSITVGAAGVGTPVYQTYTGVLPAVAIIYNRLIVPAGTTKKCAVITRLCEVNGAELQWDPSVTASASAATLQAAALAQLAALGIVTR